MAQYCAANKITTTTKKKENLMTACRRSYYKNDKNIITSLQHTGTIDDIAFITKHLNLKSIMTRDSSRVCGPNKF